MIMHNSFIYVYLTLAVSQESCHLGCGCCLDNVSAKIRNAAFGKMSENLLEDFKNVENYLMGPGNKIIVATSGIVFWENYQKTCIQLIQFEILNYYRCHQKSEGQKGFPWWG